MSDQEQHPQCYTINRLSELTGRDRRTLKRIVSNIKPVKIVGGCPHYELDDIQALLKEKSDKSLRDQKLIEEVRKLKLKNDRDEGRLVLRSDIGAKILRALSSTRGILEQRLINEAPTAVSGLEPTQIRIKNRQILDEAWADINKLQEVFE